MQKKITIPIIILAISLSFVTVNLLAEAEYQNRDDVVLPSIPLSKGIICNSPGETDPKSCVDTRDSPDTVYLSGN